jgi:hypothetical protein
VPSDPADEYHVRVRFAAEPFNIDDSETNVIKISGSGS